MDDQGKIRRVIGVFNSDFPDKHKKDYQVVLAAAYSEEMARKERLERNPLMDSGYTIPNCYRKYQ